MCEKFRFIIRVQEAEPDKINIGCCKNFEYEIDSIEHPKFKIIPTRSIPHALRDKVKVELEKIVNMGIVRLLVGKSKQLSH